MKEGSFLNANPGPWTAGFEDVVGPFGIPLIKIQAVFFLYVLPRA